MEIRISSIEGNRQKLDGGAMFGNAPRPMWERWYTPDSQGRIELACRALLIEVDGKKILCETGIGAFFEPKLADRYGIQDPSIHHLLKSLEDLGIEENSIDAVILSHLHFDHAGGLLPTYQDIQKGHDNLLFPNAMYIVGEEAWHRCQNPHLRDRASFIPQLEEKLEKSKRLVIIPKGEKSIKILPSCVSFFYSSGHTPGQVHTVIQGTKETIIFCGDLIPGSPWGHIPITMGYDRYPEKLIDEKQELYNQAIPANWLLFFTHDPQFSIGRCRYDEKKKVVIYEQEMKIIRKEI